MYARASRSALALRSTLIHDRSPSFRPPLHISPSTSTPTSTSISSSSAPFSSALTLTSLSSLQRLNDTNRDFSMSFLSRFFSSSTPADSMAAEQKVQQLIDDNAVIIFSKSYCPYCRSSKRTLDQFGAKYYAIELDQEEDGYEIQDALARLTGQGTVPNIYIGKQHIGGNSDLEAHKNRDLKNLLKRANAIDV